MYEAYIDGGCDPNPGGTAAYGVVVTKTPPISEPLPLDWSPDITGELYGIVGRGPKMSNNVAEYAALNKLLGWLDEHLLPGEKVTIYSDSKLLVNQMSGLWVAKLGKLYYEEYSKALVSIVSGEFSSQLKFVWIPRKDNLADSLATKALSKVGIHRRR